MNEAETSERNDPVERFLLVFLPVTMIVDLGWKLFFSDPGGEWPSPTVTFLDVGFEVLGLVGLVGLIVRRLRSANRSGDAAVAWMFLASIGLLAGLGLLVLRLNGPSRTESRSRSAETRPVAPPASAEEKALLEKKALALKAPTGFWDAKWLMNAEEVKRVRPYATPDDTDHLEERTRWLGRPVTVSYRFTNDRLRHVIVTFSDSGTGADFEKIQSHLQSVHGSMPTPGKTKEELLSSVYEEDIFQTEHRLTPSEVEQVNFFLTTLPTGPSTEVVPPEFHEMNWQMDASVAAVNKADSQVNNTRLSQAAAAGAAEARKLSPEDLQDHGIKLRVLINALDRGIQRLSDPGFAARLEPFFSMIESRRIPMNGKRADFDLRRWQLLRQSYAAGYEMHKLIAENWDEWRAIESLPPEAEQKPWQKEIARFHGELKEVSDKLKELYPSPPSPKEKEQEFAKLKKELQGVHASFKSRWETLLGTRWAKTESEDPAEGKNYSFATMISGAVPRLRKLSREDLTEFRQAQRALLDSYEQAFRLFEELKKTGTDPFNLGVGLTGWYLTEAKWKACHHAHKVAYAQSELLEQNWEDWRRSGPNPKGAPKPWQKKARELENEFRSAMAASDAASN